VHTAFLIVPALMVVGIALLVLAPVHIADSEPETVTT
jgi:hypothetical protein